MWESPKGDIGGFPLVLQWSESWIRDRYKDFFHGKPGKVSSVSLHFIFDRYSKTVDITRVTMKKMMTAIKCSPALDIIPLPIVIVNITKNIINIFQPFDPSDLMLLLNKKARAGISI
jgi:hypothetical protein